MFFLLDVRLEQCEVWGVKSAVWSVKCEVGSAKCEVWSVECGVWSLSLECEERSVKCEVWSVRLGVWRKQWEVRSVKCGLWSVKCGVWSLKFGVRRVQCEVWSVKTLLRLSLKKKAACRGKDTVGTGCLWTIGHLCLGNFRRRLARVYVMMIWFNTMDPLVPACWKYDRGIMTGWLVSPQEISESMSEEAVSITCMRFGRMQAHWKDISRGWVIDYEKYEQLLCISSDHFFGWDGHPKKKAW